MQKKHFKNLKDWNSRKQNQEKYFQWKKRRTNKRKRV